MRNCCLLVFILLLSACAVGTIPTALEIRRSHAGWRAQEYYPDVDFTAHVLMESANVEAQPLSYTGHDLATLHLIFTFAWRDVVGTGDSEVAECLSSGIIYVPKDSESFFDLCGGEPNHAGCQAHAEDFYLEGLGAYVQIVRHDWYYAMSDRTISANHNVVFSHEAAHRVSECIYGDNDFHHERRQLWDEVVPLAAEREREWLRRHDRMD